MRRLDLPLRMQQWIRNLFCLRQREREGLSYDAKRYVHTHLIRPHQSVATKLGRAIGESKIPLPVRNGQACRHSRGLVEGTKNKIMIQTNFLSVILRKKEKASSLCALRNGLGHVLGSFVSVLELACARAPSSPPLTSSPPSQPRVAIQPAPIFLDFGIALS